MSRSNSPHAIPRLFVPDDLSAGQHIALTPNQNHYLSHVMRLQEGDTVRLFNGRDGEWRGALGSAQNKKRSAGILVRDQMKPQRPEPDLWLCCAPIKRAHFDNMIMKAAELGIARICPVLTSRTQVREVNIGHARAIAVEAAEQSERLSVPDVEAPVTLEKMATKWPEDRLPIVCAEHGEARPVGEAFLALASKSPLEAAFMTGPEGGFTVEELELLRALPRALPVRLGPRILRADTAAIAVIACWQALAGDWR